jgi:hypothetical protein
VLELLIDQNILGYVENAKERWRSKEWMTTRNLETEMKRFQMNADLWKA